MIRDILDKDFSLPEIAGQQGINRKTARKYMNSNEVPTAKHHVVGEYKLDPYRDSIGELIRK